MTGPPHPAAGPDPTDATGPTRATDPPGARGPTDPAAPDPAEHDSTGHDSTGHDSTGHDSTGHDSTGHDSTGHDSTGHDSTGHDSTGHAPAGHDATEHDPARQAALDAVRAELAGLAAPPVPPEYAARWSAALAAEGDRPASGPDTVEPLAPARATRDPRRRWPRPAAVAAVLLGALLVAGVPGTGSPSPAVDRVGLAAAALAALGSTDVGELADPTRRAGCLRALPDAGVAPEAALLGGRRVTYAGRAAVLLVLATGERGRFRVLVVDPACGPAGGTLLGSEPVGGR